MRRAGSSFLGLLSFLLVSGCAAPPLDREDNDKLIARCYAKERPETYRAVGGETAASVVERYYNYLAPYLIADALSEIASRNKLEPRSVLKKDDILKLPAPAKLLRPDFRMSKTAPRETALILGAWEKYRVYECGMVDIVLSHEHKGGAEKIDLPLPSRLVKTSKAGAELLARAVQGLERKKIKGAGPAKALGQLREIGFAAGIADEFRFDADSLKLSKSLDTGLQRFTFALEYAEAWARGK